MRERGMRKVIILDGLRVGRNEININQLEHRVI